MSNRSLNVHLLEAPEPEVLNHLHGQLDSKVNVTIGHTLPKPARFEVLVSGRPAPKDVAASPNLRALVVPWAGLPPETRDLAKKHGLAVHNLHHNAANVAEMALGLLLAAAQRLVPADRALRQGDWRIRYLDVNPTVLLGGKTAVILGYGEIGRRVAAACRALGMNVKATKADPRSVPVGCPDAVFPPEALDELLPHATALIVCLPSTRQTRGLLGARALARLPRPAVLVNVGRGEVVEERALFEALRSGALYAAGLDVWYTYPTDEPTRANCPPSQFPFHELDNVVMSPHRAGAFNVAETERLRMSALAELFNAAAAGRPMPNAVDLDKGY